MADSGKDDELQQSLQFDVDLCEQLVKRFKWAVSDDAVPLWVAEEWFFDRDDTRRNQTWVEAEHHRRAFAWETRRLATLATWHGLDTQLLARRRRHFDRYLGGGPRLPDADQHAFLDLVEVIRNAASQALEKGVNPAKVNPDQTDAGDKSDPYPPEDASAYVSATVLFAVVDWSYRTGKRWLDKVPESEIRRRKPNRQRLEIHAGDWHRYWGDQAKKVEADDEAAERIVEGITHRRNEKNQRNDQLRGK